jgi:site-specific DNA recombinase
MARRTPKSRNDNLLPDIAKQARRLRVAIYIRISSDGEHQPFSVEAQRTKLASYIDIQPDWETPARFSATKPAASPPNARTCSPR